LAATVITKLRFQTDPPDRNYANLGTGVTLVLPKGLQVFLELPGAGGLQWSRGLHGERRPPDQLL